MTYLKPLIPLWPYVMVCAGLVIALVANARIRKRYKRVIEQHERSLKEAGEVRYDLEKVIQQYARKHIVLQSILIRIHPHGRTIANDPAKLEAWLEKLKGKKKKSSAKK